jgi:hypothetical protein
MTSTATETVEAACSPGSPWTPLSCSSSAHPGREPRMDADRDEEVFRCPSIASCSSMPRTPPGHRQPGTVLLHRPEPRPGRSPDDRRARRIPAGPFFCTALHDPGAVRYRHEIQRDLKQEPVRAAVQAFAAGMHDMRAGASAHRSEPLRRGDTRITRWPGHALGARAPGGFTSTAAGSRRTRRRPGMPPPGARRSFPDPGFRAGAPRCPCGTPRSALRSACPRVPPLRAL